MYDKDIQISARLSKKYKINPLTGDIIKIIENKIKINHRLPKKM